MNIKSIAPKIQINSSKKELLNQFLLSLIATTISIVLTFGTAIWLDNNKKEEAKHEMVMMIIYDLSNTLKEVEEADALIQEGFEQQLAIAASPQLLEQDPTIIFSFTPQIEYTETVERIFSSNIETINTLGNVLFAENVSDLYQLRKQYKEVICDVFTNEIKELDGIYGYEQVVNIPYYHRKFMSKIFLNRMKEKFLQCQQMMNVSDEDLEIYRQKRQDMELTAEQDSIRRTLFNQCDKDKQLLIEAIQKGKQQ